jgi:hypothetical protein
MPGYINAGGLNLEKSPEHPYSSIIVQEMF